VIPGAKKTVNKNTTKELRVKMSDKKVNTKNRGK